MSTYNLGFFFGPGLPLGLGTLLEPSREPRLKPGAGPFLFLDGAPSPVGVGASVNGAGFEAVSEGLSFDEEFCLIGI